VHASAPSFASPGDSGGKSPLTRLASSLTQPVLVSAFVPASYLAQAVIGTTLVLLVALGALAAQVGGASLTRGALRVVFWGALAMGASALIGRLFGTTVS
jgi:VIT1/CCC1 family predicted Fe2+/Mn2+ transporter